MKALAQTAAAVSPDLEEAKQAKDAARLFADIATASPRKKTLSLLADAESTRPIEIPANAFRLFVEILNEMGKGNAVNIVPSRHELTSQQAADLMNVSRPYFVKLLEAGAMPFRRVGSRRRVRFEHVMAYLEKMKRESREAIDELAAQAQELNMGY